MTPRNTFGTGEAGLQVHHPPVYQSGTTLGSGGSTVQVSSELRQSLVPQGWAHVCLHFLYNYLHPISIFHEEIMADYLRGIIFFLFSFKK
jgi:hypothetical protein